MGANALIKNGALMIKGGLARTTGCDCCDANGPDLPCSLCATTPTSISMLLQGHTLENNIYCIGSAGSAQYFGDPNALNGTYDLFNTSYVNSIGNAMPAVACRYVKWLFPPAPMKVSSDPCPAAGTHGVPVDGMLVEVNLSTLVSGGSTFRLVSVTITIGSSSEATARTVFRGTKTVGTTQASLCATPLIAVPNQINQHFNQDYCGCTGTAYITLNF